MRMRCRSSSRTAGRARSSSRSRSSTRSSIRPRMAAKRRTPSMSWFRICRGTGSRASRPLPAGAPSASRAPERADEAPRVHALRRAGRRLGRAHRGRDGDAGTSRADRHSHEHARRGSARRSTRRSGPAARRRQSSPPRRSSRTRCWQFTYKNVQYAFYMASRPQTLYAINDSPVGLAAWLLDHDPRSLEMIARVL